jgi:o-succinylbenzoate synthase
MAIKVHIKRHVLKFRFPARTSRGILDEKTTYFIVIQKGDKLGIGECSTIPGLSLDDVPGYDTKIQWVSSKLKEGRSITELDLNEFPSIRFGFETALLDLENGGKRKLFPGNFSNGKKNIPINGLIWMGSKESMLKQVEEKLRLGFNCLKLKIGALDFNSELEILHKLRNEYNNEDLELRLDANGSFNCKDALEKLKRLSAFSIHSIEQPIKAGLYEEMAKLCLDSPIPIALDEDLIGNFNAGDKMALIQKVSPAYIIIKPSMVGGIGASLEWITAAERNNAGWWATSALESNIGLNAIAQ